jgi:hypothetical protein
MAKKLLESITKTKANPKVVAGVIILVMLIGVSFIGASLLSTGGAYVGDNESSDSSKNERLAEAAASKPQPTTGWCVYRVGIFGANGGHMTKENCKGRETDGDPNTKWYAFCPDIQGQGKRKEEDCTCNHNDIEKSNHFLENVINKREQLIYALNDGDITADDNLKSIEFTIAASLKCACPINISGRDPDPNNSDKIKAFPCPGNHNCQGTWGLATSTNITFSKMRTLQNNCEVFPEGCYISSTYSPRGNNHSVGKAIDICCDGPDSSQSSTCLNPKVDELIRRIMHSDDMAFKILRECTKKERGGPKDSEKCPTPNNTSGCLGGLVHIDINWGDYPFVQIDCNSAPRRPTGYIPPPVVAPLSF